MRTLTVWRVLLGMEETIASSFELEGYLGVGLDIEDLGTAILGLGELH